MDLFEVFADIAFCTEVIKSYHWENLTSFIIIKLLILAETFNTNLSSVAFHFLRQKKAAITKSSFNKTIQQNPFYPSLYSLSDTFNKYSINNKAFKIEPENLANVPAPFIAYIETKNNGDDFVSVISNRNSKIVYSPDGKKEVSADLKDFLKNFRDIIFVATLNPESGEDNYKQKRIKEILHQTQNILFTLIGCFALLGLSTNIIKTSSAFFSSLSIFVIIYSGLFVSILLVIYELDKSNTFIKTICSGGNSKVDCNAVLESNASRLFGVSWSEYGFFLFSFLLLFLIFPSIPFYDKMPLIALILTLCSLYIPFSIYYQVKIVKQWCSLCLAIQVILFAGLCWALSTYWLKEIYIPTFKVFSVFLILTLFILPIGSWFFLKPIFLKAKDPDTFSFAYKRLLYNPEIFKSILEQQPSAAGGWENIGIDIGSASAQNTIIKVCNPHCGPCSTAHQILEEIIESNVNIRLKIIFTATNREDDISSKPAKHMLAIAKNTNENITKKAISDWYKSPTKDYRSFAEKYPLESDLSSQNNKIDAMREWCNKTQITFTPTIFINGWRLPEMYSLEELKIFGLMGIF